MPSLSRGQRRLLRYATDDEDVRRLKRKRAEEVAPVLQQRKQKQRCSFTNTKETTNASQTDLPLCSEVLEYMQKHCPNAPRKLRQNQLRLVRDLSNSNNSSNNTGVSSSSSGNNDDHVGMDGEGAFSVKRMEIVDQPDVFAVVTLSALQRRALHVGPNSLGASLLLIVDNDAIATALASYMKKTFHIKHTFILDGSRFPTYPTIDENIEATTELGESTVVVITSIESFLAVDARSAVWKFIGAYAVLLRSPSGTNTLIKSMKDEESKEFFEKLCRQRWRCLGHVRMAAVIAPSRKALFAPLADTLTTAAPAVEGENNTTTNNKNNNNNNKETTTTTTTTPTSGNGNGSNKQETEVVAATAIMRSPVTMHYAVVEGSHRFQTLYTLLMNLRSGQGVVVHFATKEATQFMYDVLYALGELPASLMLLTDYEGNSSYASVQDNDESRRQLCTQFDKIIAESSHQESSSNNKKDRVVLLSAFGLVPQRGTIFVQYDIMVDIVNFTQFVSDVLTPAAYNDAALDPAMRRRSRTPPPMMMDRKGSKGNTSKHTNTSAGHNNNNNIGGTLSHGSTTVPPKVMYQHILLLLRQNELQAALPYIQTPAKRLHIKLEPMPQLPSATRYLLSVQKMQSLHKKQFAIQNAAYAAYRATMLLYSLVGPADVYDARRVDLNLAAAEFGYTAAPILDLRTRETEFRPREDIFRAARERMAVERRRTRAYAETHIIGEAPEEHIVDEDANGDEAVNMG